MLLQHDKISIFLWLLNILYAVLFTCLLIFLYRTELLRGVVMSCVWRGTYFPFYLSAERALSKNIYLRASTAISSADEQIKAAL